MKLHADFGVMLVYAQVKVESGKNKAEILDMIGGHGEGWALRRRSSPFLPATLMKSSIVLVWVFVIHAIGLYLFTRGFLLTRLSLSQTNTHDELLTPTHNRAVILIIDALRFDFISPDPPQPRSPHYHDILKLPAQLTVAQPRNSFIFNSFSDPPTATLQRIKGITTGSLPTFVDIGNSFGGSAVDEDSIVNQLRLSGKRVRPSDDYSRFTPDTGTRRLLLWGMTRG